MDDHKKILIVDDSVEQITLLTDMLETKYPGIVSARDGKEGLAAAKREKPDLILLDMRMPGMNGIEVVEALQQDPATAEIPVMVFTGSHFDRQTKTLCQRQPNVKAFLDKAMPLDKILERVAEYLD